MVREHNDDNVNTLKLYNSKLVFLSFFFTDKHSAKPDLALCNYVCASAGCAFAHSTDLTLTFSWSVCRSLNFQCPAPPLWVSWCWLRLTKSLSHCSQKTLGFPARFKWSPQRETSTTFPSTAGSVAARCTFSEREQVCGTVLVYHTITKQHTPRKD